jgi:hypothetical protein
MALPAAVRCCLVLLLAWPLVACSGTPFGDQLGDSFSEPAGPAEPAPQAQLPQQHQKPQRRIRLRRLGPPARPPAPQ